MRIPPNAPPWEKVIQAVQAVHSVSANFSNLKLCRTVVAGVVCRNALSARGHCWTGWCVCVGTGRLPHNPHTHTHHREQSLGVGEVKRKWLLLVCLVEYGRPYVGRSTMVAFSCVTCVRRRRQLARVPRCCCWGVEWPFPAPRHSHALRTDIKEAFT